MPNLEVKKQIVQEISQKMANSKSVILADYRGLKVGEETQLRRELRQAGVEYRVIKNTLATLAVRELGLTELEPHLKGPTAIAFGFDDPVSPAKLLTNFAKTNKKIKIKVGVVEGKIINLDEVKALAELPPREILLTQVAGALQSPIYSWVSLLQAPIRNLANVLDQIRQQKEGLT